MRVRGNQPYLTDMVSDISLGWNLHGMSTPDDVGTVLSCMNLFLRGGSGQKVSDNFLGNSCCTCCTEQLASFMRLRHIFIYSSSAPLGKSGNKQLLQKKKGAKLNLVKLHMLSVTVIWFVELLKQIFLDAPEWPCGSIFVLVWSGTKVVLL